MNAEQRHTAAAGASEGERQMEFMLTIVPEGFLSKRSELRVCCFECRWLKEGETRFAVATAASTLLVPVRRDCV